MLGPTGETWRAIRRVLMDHWDPIGVRGMPEAEDEYDHYIHPVFHLLAQHPSASEITAYLRRVEEATMGLSPRPDGELFAAAQELLKIEPRGV
jgi:hypothetical protein